MKKPVFVLALALLLYISPQLTTAQEITIFPDNPDVGNCFPFGSGEIGLPDDTWPPFMGFIYQNIPPFSLATGDTLAFDMGMVASADVMVDIELARTATNGGITPSGAFVEIVSNTQTPLNPRGDNIVGNFEMQFTAEAPFIFPGGGLIIRFSNPSAQYQLNTNCDQVLVNTDNTDSSGFFVQRFYSDPDGLPPYLFEDNSNIGAFRVIATGSVIRPIPTLSEWGLIAAAVGLGIMGIVAVRRKSAARV